MLRYEESVRPPAHIAVYQRVTMRQRVIAYNSAVDACRDGSTGKFRALPQPGSFALSTLDIAISQRTGHVAF